MTYKRYLSEYYIITVVTASSLLHIPTQTYLDLFHLLYQVDVLLQNACWCVHMSCLCCVCVWLVLFCARLQHTSLWHPLCPQQQPPCLCGRTAPSPPPSYACLSTLPSWKFPETRTLWVITHCKTGCCVLFQIRALDIFLCADRVQNCF